MTDSVAMYREIRDRLAQSERSLLAQISQRKTLVACPGAVKELMRTDHLDMIESAVILGAPLSVSDFTWAWETKHTSALRALVSCTSEDTMLQARAAWASDWFPSEGRWLASDAHAWLTVESMASIMGIAVPEGPLFGADSLSDAAVTVRVKTLWRKPYVWTAQATWTVDQCCEFLLHNGVSGSSRFAPIESTRHACAFGVDCALLGPGGRQSAANWCTAANANRTLADLGVATGTTLFWYFSVLS